MTKWLRSSMPALAATLGLCLVFFNLSGCGGTGAPPAAVDPDGAAAGPPADDTPARTVLTTSMPALGALPAGSEFAFTIAGEFAGELFAGSGRVLYDPAVVQPLGQQRGGFISAAPVYLCRLDLAPGALVSPEARLSAVIPFAFTGLPGERGRAGRGELVRLRFRLLSPPAGGAPVRLLNDPQYLQLRDAQGRRLSFDFASAEVSQ